MSMTSGARIEPGGGDALLLVDMQNDFLPGGALAVPEASGLLDTVNAYIDAFHERRLPIVATRDWHPPGHCSFRAQGGPWPDHCIADSAGAAFPRAMRLPDDALVVSKATRREADAYSGFDGTDLADRLRELGVRRVFVAGLATDYCVLATTLDALKAGFEVLLLEDAVRAVEVKSGDAERALEEMRAAGAASMRIEQLAA